MSVETLTFGCRLNTFESEVMKDQAKSAGLDNVVIVNSCAVTQEAVRQTRQAIRKARRENPDVKIVVTGCAAQTDAESFAEMGEVDLVVGNAEKMKAETYQGMKFGMGGNSKILVDDIMSVKETAGHLIEGMDGRARAFVQVQIRVMVQTESTAAIVFYFSVIASVVSLMTLPFGWTLPPLNTLLLLASTGLFGGIAQILVTAAYRYGSASMLAPYDYSSMIFAVIIGYVIFGELPTLVILLGAALVIAGNVVVILREQQLGLDRRKARSVTDPKSS